MSGGVVAWAVDVRLSDTPAPPSAVVGVPVLPTDDARDLAPKAAREGNPVSRADRSLPAQKKTSPTVPERGTGTFAVIPVVSGLAPDPEAESYSIEIEGGLKLDRTVVAQTIDSVLADRRGWRASGHQLTRTATDPDFRIIIASPRTTDQQCAPLETQGRVSCHNQAGNVILNARRWTEGIEDYRGALVDYRTYLINHEVGHHLGYDHQQCPAPGQPAPVMMQQTYGLEGCTRNVWPD